VDPTLATADLRGAAAGAAPDRLAVVGGTAVVLAALPGVVALLPAGAGALGQGVLRGLDRRKMNARGCCYFGASP
jgi:hypothetical protein